MTVALPIISATGIECSGMPTAVLSTHTGGFTGFTYRDLTEDMVPITDHWVSLGLKFEGIYTGFLGSFEQIDLVCDIIDRIGKDDGLVFVDPVMADNGMLYKIFPDTFPQGMKKLCSKADVILPNITEAVLMLGEEYHDGPYTEEYISGLLKRLAALGPKKVVLTGVNFDEKSLGAAAYDAESGEIVYAFSERIPGYYHGTGDIFSSVVVSCIMNGLSLKESIENAVDFTYNSILRTYKAGSDVKYGVNFEEGFPKLLKDMGL